MHYSGSSERLGKVRHCRHRIVVSIPACQLVSLPGGMPSSCPREAGVRFPVSACPYAWCVLRTPFPAFFTMMLPLVNEQKAPKWGNPGCTAQHVGGQLLPPCTTPLSSQPLQPWLCPFKVRISVPCVHISSPAPHPRSFTLPAFRDPQPHPPALTLPTTTPRRKTHIFRKL